ncbi:MAG: PAS domain S-box protein, partial [Planctomycetota bacterium]
YSARALQHSNDEVGLLIKGFNEMLEQIQQRDSALVGAKEKLEEKVRERTSDLTKEIAERERGQRWVEGLNQLKEHLLTSVNLEEKLKHITDGVVRIFGADFARIWLIRPGDLCHCDCIHAGVTEGPHVCRHRDRCLHLLASSGRYTHTDGEVHQRVPFGCYNIGRLASAKSSKFLTNTVTQDPQVHDHAWAEELGLVSFAGYPLLAGTEEPVGVLALFNKSPISREEDAMLETVASTTAQVILTVKAEDAVRESEERYRAVVENTRDIIHSMTLDGTVTFISPQVSSLGYSIDEVVGHNIGEFIHPDDRDHVMSDIAVTFERGETPAREFRFLKKDGSHIYVEEACSATYDGDRTVQVTGSIRDISERKCAEEELEEAHKRLVQASHQAGMAEVAADVLHNVGNVLNSINVSTTLISEKVSASKAANLKKAADMIAEHIEDLGTFLSEDARGKHIPAYLTKVTRLLIDDQADIVELLLSLAANVEHIKQVIGMQQSYAKASGVEVPTDLAEVLENAIEINSAALDRHKVRLIRDLAKLPQVNIDKQRVLQILVNLISNAKYALSKSGNQEKSITIRSYRSGEDRLRIEVIDNGVGLSKENLTKIFRHGFTTKSEGHGFGLHSGALAAKEIGGSLTAYSDGEERGAKFTLELPFRPVEVVK